MIVNPIAIEIRINGCKTGWRFPSKVDSKLLIIQWTPAWRDSVVGRGNAIARDAQDRREKRQSGLHQQLPTEFSGAGPWPAVRRGALSAALSVSGQNKTVIGVFIKCIR
ncbi:MAG: hypothetical protein L0Z50_01235, partial [Verrucomicrobiales bacterium]|nr:hypothetical protein [Verrucomicrobiales bacterium]